MTENTTTERPTVVEMINSLTGYDEIAIEKNYGGVDFFELKGLTTIRALVFVQLRRDGQADKDAKRAVLEMTVGECNAFFTEDTETDPEQPVTEPGKDSEPPS